jgi:rare lipoprotein A
MHERAGTRLGNISPLELFALLTIAGAVFIKTAPHIGPLTTAPKSDNPATIAEATPDKPVARLVARAELQKTKTKSATARAWVQPRDAAQPPEEATAAESRSKIVMTAVALPLPHPAPKRGSAMLTFTAPPLPVAAPKHTQSDAPPLLKRAPQEVRTKGAGSALQQMGRASWYTLDSPTASGEKIDDAALTAAHNFLPFGTKVLVENVANGHSVVVRINDRGPFVAGRIIDLSKAAAEAIDLIPTGVTDVRVSVIYQIEDLKSGARGSSTIRTASVNLESKPIRPNSQAAKVDPQSRSVKHKKRAVREIGTPATSTIRTASVDPESKPVTRNSQAAKVDPQSKSAKHKKRAVSEIGTPATSAPASVVKPRGLFGGMKRADGRESSFPGFLKSVFGNPIAFADIGRRINVRFTPQ